MQLTVFNKYLIAQNCPTKNIGGKSAHSSHKFFQLLWSNYSDQTVGFLVRQWSLLYFHQNIYIYITSRQPYWLNFNKTCHLSFFCLLYLFSSNMAMEIFVFWISRGRLKTRNTADILNTKSNISSKGPSSEKRNKSLKNLQVQCTNCWSKCTFNIWILVVTSTSHRIFTLPTVQMYNSMYMQYF